MLVIPRQRGEREEDQDYEQERNSLVATSRDGQTPALSGVVRQWHTPRVSAEKIRVAVIGTGSLGKEHARLYAELARTTAVEFAGVFDANPEAARKHLAEDGKEDPTKVQGSAVELTLVATAIDITTP